MLGFRVWDTQEKTFYSSPSWSTNQEGKLMWGECRNDDKRYISMQSTGIKDSDGVVIFEGDILSIDIIYEDGTEEEIIYLLQNSVEAAMYFSAMELVCFTYHILCDQTHDNEFEAKINAKIIGNMYDNPELLEKINVGI